MLDINYSSPKPTVIPGARHDWELVIGMEVHDRFRQSQSYFPEHQPNLEMSQILMYHSLMLRCRGCCP